VTVNLGDLPSETSAQFGIDALHPDEFVHNLIKLAPGPVCGAAKPRRESSKAPPRTVEQFLATFTGQSLPQTVTALRAFADVL